MNIRTSDEILVPISIGELIDKISILKIKLNKMKGKQLSNVKNELKALEAIVKAKNLLIEPSISKNLNEVNLLLWEIEDKIRLKEMNNMFDNEFIQLARSVYQQNDKRASLKRKINCMYNSQFIEEKLYS
tara:strand:- start:315 stop:704 length:390 start_codon:yes stop_codon:yes gene_type:complete